ncbi:hypothetical protein NDU88_004454 [Pleurodeles waltl]|uniref:Uncharacterized protein n=1 Tax=Pleurodeles waltl TaxID=8319 RepID=A0AAV7MXJ2_PLEWA|nr:hypothetical protein NDU88_004454 [Pleurodeles waltl]
MFTFIGKLTKFYATQVKYKSQGKTSMQVRKYNLKKFDMKSQLELKQLENEVQVIQVISTKEKIISSMDLEIYGKGTTPFKHASSFLPSFLGDGSDIFSELVAQEIKKLQIAISKRQARFNPKRFADQNWIKKIQVKSSVVIRIADKGENIVVWLLQLYKKEAINQLNNVDCYMRIMAQSAKEIKFKFHSELTEWRNEGLLIYEEFFFLKNDYWKIPIFYLSPRVHKDPRQPPGCLIISAIDSLLESS